MLAGYFFFIFIIFCLRCAFGTPPSVKPTASPTTVFSAACPAGWATGIDRCYLLDNGDKNWQDCKTYCATKGGYLPCILGTYQTDLINALHPTTSGLTWIGFNDIASEGSFVWDNGCSNTFTAWQASNPDNFNNNEDCGALVAANNQWGDLPCSSGVGCTCEQQFTSTGNACPAGWIVSEDGTFCIYFENTVSTYTACESTCTALSATMLCIRNAADNAFIYKFRSSRTFTWVGYNRASGSYHWPAGCTSTYTNWGASEPNNGAGEYYAAMYNGAAGQWADVLYDRSPANCACQKPAYIRTVAPTTQPTIVPTTSPSTAPTNVPTASPSTVPSTVPTAAPTMVPSLGPSAIPSVHPSATPTLIPSAHPSVVPTIVPTAAPTMPPSVSPTGDPTTGPTAAPSLLPSTLPTTDPTTPPSVFPSQVPSLAPTGAPSAAPTPEPSVQPTLLPTCAPSALSLSAYLAAVSSSPTYRPKIGFAFAAVGSDGSVHAWGEASKGGDSSDAQHRLSAGAVAVVASRYAFAALISNGSVVPWGDRASVSGAPGPDALVDHLVATEGAFAGIEKHSGAILAFGVASVGGDAATPSRYNQFASQLASNAFTTITATACAFSAVTAAGNVYSWGSDHCGAGTSTETLPSLTNVLKVTATREAFAALLASGGVLTWGGKLGGGNSTAVASLLTDVIHISASRTVFAAFTANTSLVVWGYPAHGGDASAVAADLTSEVVSVAQTFTAMAAVKVDGTVRAWGSADGGGDAAAVQAQLVNVVKLYGASKAFAALTATGKVVAWGRAAYGGQIPASKAGALSSGVVSVYHTDRAFVALKIDGSVVVWGQAGHGGSPGAAVHSLLVSGVHTICANDVAFSAIKTDGSVVGWGHPVSIPTAGMLFNSSALQGNVTCFGEI